MKVVYQRKTPREPKYIGVINATVRCKGYAKKYKEVTINVYDTTEDTFAKNDCVGYPVLLRVLKMNGYFPKYVLSERGKMEQRLVHEASN